MRKEMGETYKVLHCAPEITENNPKLYEDIQSAVRAKYFKNQPSNKEFFNNIKSEVENKESTGPTMRDLLVHTLECSPERVEPIDAQYITTIYGKLISNYIVKGNYKVQKEIKELTEKHISDKVNLYDAQSNIKECIIEKYGTEFYHKSAEAINFIIEAVYSDNQRDRMDAWI